MRTRTRKRQRGAATVETALSLIVILPVVFYAILLTDLLQHHLDLQEVTLSSVWDFAFLDYADSPKITDTQRQNQLMWCDHTSAYDSYNKGYDCDAEVHHTEMGAKVCWLDDADNSGGKNVAQVTCTNDTGTARTVDVTGLLFHDEYTKGGLFTCTAQAYAMNFFVPETLFAEFGTGQMHARNKFDESSSVHSQGSDAAGGNVFVYPRSDHALLTDTWAMNEAPDELPGQDGRLQQRAEFLFHRNLGFPEYTAAAGQFLLSSETEILLPGLALLRGANPLKANVALKKFSSGSGPVNQGHFATPFRDWDGDQNRGTWQQRGSNYLGCTSPESC